RALSGRRHHALQEQPRHRDRPDERERDGAFQQDREPRREGREEERLLWSARGPTAPARSGAGPPRKTEEARERQRHGAGQSGAPPEPGRQREHHAAFHIWVDSNSRRYTSHRTSSSACVPRSTTRPASITTIRSAISGTVWILCVMKNVVRPFTNSFSAAWMS